MSELEKLRGVVLVMEGDAVAFQYAAGIAERSSGMMCTQDTRFQLASVSKQFTAAAILVLVARGVVSVEDQVSPEVTGNPLPTLPARGRDKNGADPRRHWRGRIHSGRLSRFFPATPQRHSAEGGWGGNLFPPHVPARGGTKLS